MTGTRGITGTQWKIITGSFLVYMCTNGVLIYVLPLLYPALMREHGWSGEQVTSPAALFFLCSSVLLPAAGWIFDRFPVRRVMAIGAVLQCIGLVMFANLVSLGTLTVAYLVLSLSIALCGMVASMVLLTRWFTANRGVAISITLMGASIGGAVFPLLLGWLTELYNWSSALLIIAALAGAILFGTIAFLLRERPEQDAAPATAPAGAPAAMAPAAGLTLRQAVRTPTFYLLALTTAVVWFLVVGLSQHQAIYLANEVGVAERVLPLIFSLFFWCALVGKIVFGWISDRCNKLLTMCGSFVVMAVGLVMLRLASAEQPLFVYGFAVLFGFGFSGAFTMIQIVLAQFYQGRDYGKLLGIFTMMDTLAGGIGIRVIGAMQSNSGSYNSAIMMTLVLALFSIVSTVALHWLHRNEVSATPVPQRS